MALMDSNGPLDKYNLVCGTVISLTWCLAVGVEISAAEDLLRNLYSMFGILDAGGHLEIVTGGHVGTALAAFALPVLGTYIPALLLGKEDAGSRRVRHEVGFWVYLGFIFFGVKFIALGDPFGTSTSNLFFLSNNAFMTYLHYQWIGNDIRSKFKVN